jgi:Tfp pilus assembly protein PilP
MSLGRTSPLARFAAAVSAAVSIAGALAPPGGAAGPDDRGLRRDPFRPFTLARAATEVNPELVPPLERYAVAQLELVGVAHDARPPRAIVEDAAGLGFILRPGTRIGPNGGVVAQIAPRLVVIEEWHTDAIGERHRSELRLELSKDERRVAR